MSRESGPDIAPLIGNTLKEEEDKKGAEKISSLINEELGERNPNTEPIDTTDIAGETSPQRETPALEIPDVSSLEGETPEDQRAREARESLTPGEALVEELVDGIPALVAAEEGARKAREHLKKFQDSVIELEDSMQAIKKEISDENKAAFQKTLTVRKTALAEATAKRDEAKKPLDDLLKKIVDASLKEYGFIPSNVQKTQEDRVSPIAGNLEIYVEQLLKNPSLKAGQPPDVAQVKKMFAEMKRAVGVVIKSEQTFKKSIRKTAPGPEVPGSA